MTVSEISRTLRRRRLSLGWSLAELARRARTSAPTVHRYETGWRRFELYTLDKLAAALDCRLEIRLVPVGRREKGASAPRTAARIERLFWDRRLRASDLETFPEWVVKRVLELGTLDDVAALRAYLGRDRLLEVVEQVHFGSRRTQVFWSKILELEGRPCTRKFSREEASASWTH